MCLPALLRDSQRSCNAINARSITRYIIVTAAHCCCSMCRAHCAAHLLVAVDIYSYDHCSCHRARESDHDHAPVWQGRQARRRTVEEVEKYLSWTWTGMEMTGMEMTEKEEEEEGRKITEYNIRTVTPHAAAGGLIIWLASAVAAAWSARVPPADRVDHSTHPAQLTTSPRHNRRRHRHRHRG